MKKTPVIIIGAVVVVVAFVAIIAASAGKKDSMATGDSMSSNSSSSSQSNTPAPMDATATNAVTISNYMFGPTAVKVKVGDTVTWTNNDSVRHNVVGDDNELPEGKLIAKGETYSYTFKKAGVYNYHCSPHPYMKATVVVE